MIFIILKLIQVCLSFPLDCYSSSFFLFLFYSELISGRRQAAHTRYIANKDSTGRMAESLRHLKTEMKIYRGAVTY
jgi:hypothetical protein